MKNKVGNDKKEGVKQKKRKKSSRALKKKY